MVKGPAHHSLGDQPADSRGTQFLIEKCDPVPALGLGPVEGKVGFGEQLVGVAISIGRARHADAHRAGEVLVADSEGFTTSLDDPVGQRYSGVDIRHVLGHQDELVAAQASQCVRGAKVAHETLCHFQQHFVANAVTERIVDELEAVKVEVQHSQYAVMGPGEPAQAVAQAVHEHRPVGHTGQRVRRRPALERGRVILSFRDVADGGHNHGRAIELDLARCCLDPTVRPVATQEPVTRGHGLGRRHLSRRPCAAPGGEGGRVVRVDKFVLVTPDELGEAPSEHAPGGGRAVQVTPSEIHHRGEVGRGGDDRLVVDLARHGIHGELGAPKLVHRTSCRGLEQFRGGGQW